MTLFEMIKTRPYEMQQEFSCGVRRQNENEVLVSVWRPKAKKCPNVVVEFKISFLEVMLLLKNI